MTFVAGEASIGAATVEPVVLACSGPVYVPVVEDAGCKLAVRCTPVATGTDGAAAPTVKGDAQEAVSGVLPGQHYTVPYWLERCDTAKYWQGAYSPKTYT